jgi:steroid delta-isomerase-like uncharacterized protein
MEDGLRQRRLEVLAAHFQSEVDHDWDTCIGTFNGHPRYEIMPTGQVFDGEQDVRNYHRRQREAFPDQRHENARFHCADDTVIAEFDLLGTNTGPLLGRPPTGKAFRVPAIAVFFFDGDHITNERVYLDIASMFRQIGQVLPG